MKSGIIKHELALKFILGGKSFVTFLNTKTDNRFTFKVVKHKKDDINKTKFTSNTRQESKKRKFKKTPCRFI